VREPGHPAAPASAVQVRKNLPAFRPDFRYCEADRGVWLIGAICTRAAAAPSPPSSRSTTLAWSSTTRGSGSRWPS